MLSKADRLTSRDIDCLKEGKSVFGTLISMRFLPHSVSKFSVSVSKKTAPLAVDRNRIRRRVYEAVRLAKKGLKKPAIIMLMPKKDCKTCLLSDIEREITTLFTKAHLS